MDKLPQFNLPVWMNKGEPVKLMRACRAFWQQVYTWIKWPLNQTDPLTCIVPLLNVLAYQRDVTRFPGEPLTLFRKRVHFAFINAKDAGSVAGFIAIFARLGVGYVELLERQPDLDWDVITVRVTDSQLAENSELLMNIIRQYGRTCRRYRYEIITPVDMHIRAGHVGCEYICYSASTVSNEVTTAFGAS
ncbi:hypothetical protein B4902_08635 [Yersinia frederiksenii]|uniref:hypothetical protein n=1 Tax=Yersinia frederiksenii TaxID=29484 RepID=UPI000B48A2E2|nr:hypothetical protein [Yersinia frederiksenii]OWF73331.1 hypothetical protein B4902_08635 [Yersinia frederiksenii]